MPGHRLATGYSRGAVGTYSNVACLQPVGAAGWYRLMQGDFAAAHDIEARIVRFIENCVLPYSRQGYSDPARTSGSRPPAAGRGAAPACAGRTGSRSEAAAAPVGRAARE